jgi:hypothetical protein
MPTIQRLDTTRSEGLDNIHGRNLVATALGVPRACAREVKALQEARVIKTHLWRCHVADRLLSHGPIKVRLNKF